MTKLVITQPAQEELRKIWLYIAENSYQQYADAQLDLLLKECELLIHQPQMGTLKPNISEGLRQFPINRYNIYYRYQNNTIYILHIVAAAQNIKQFEF